MFFLSSLSIKIWDKKIEIILCQQNNTTLKRQTKISFVIILMKQIGILSFMHYLNLHQQQQQQKQQHTKAILQKWKFCLSFNFFGWTQVAPGTFCTISLPSSPPTFGLQMLLEAKLRHSRIHTHIDVVEKKFFWKGVVFAIKLASCRW